MNAVEAARAYVKTYMENSDLVKGIGAAKRQLTDLGGKMTSVGAAFSLAAAPILGFGLHAATSFADASGALTDMSQVTGLGVETLSEMSYAATRLGSDIDSLGGALNKQTKFLGDLSSGSKSAHETLGRLGLTMADLEGRSPDETFGIFADAIAGVDDQTTKANFAMDLFGKSGADLLPMLNQGSAGMAAMRQEARDLGLVMSEDAVRSGDEFSDAMDRLWAQTSALTMGVGAALAPALTDLLAAVTPLITSTIGWVTENSELILQVFAVTAGVGAFGTALVTLGGILAGVGLALGAIVTVGTAVAAVIGAMLSPIGLVVGGIAVLVAGVGELTGAWSAMADIFGEAFGVALRLLKKGELQLAMKSLWVAVKLTWSEGVAYTLGLVEDMIKGTISLLTDGLLVIADGFEMVGLSAASEELKLFSDELNSMEFDLFKNAREDVKELRREMDKLNRISQPARIKTPDPTKPEYKSGQEGAGEEEDEKKPIRGLAPALSGTFSSVASRQLYSGAGNVVESELKSINRNTAETAKEVKKKYKVGP